MSASLSFFFEYSLNPAGRILLIWSSILACNLSANSQSLPTQLRAYLQNLPAASRISLAVEPLQPDQVQTDSTTFYHRADDRLPSASLIKLPILVEAMEWVKAGHLDLDEIHILVDSEKVGGTGVLATYPSRSRVSYRDLMTLMITHSDNTATNILIQEIGLDAVNERMQALGLIQSRLNRVMMDTVAVQRGMDNYVSARELNILLKKIARHEVATPALGNQMLEMLQQNKDDTLTIPRLLPKTVPIAHKTGILPYVRGDAGIVYARRPFVLSVLVQGTTTQAAEQIIGEIALLCYRYFEK